MYFEVVSDVVAMLCCNYPMPEIICIVCEDSACLCNDPHLWEPIPEGAKLEVRGAEIVPPLRHAVALVHRKQRQTRACLHRF